MSEKRVIMQCNRIKKNFRIRRGVKLRALDNINIKIYEGEKFGVVGESGCGKSTLGRVILQLYPPSSGAVVYYGRSLEEVCPKYLEKEIARLPAYQKNAREYYKKHRELEEQAAALEKQGGDKKKLEELREKSDKLRRKANRELREGSRTAGSMILSPHLPEIQKLLEEARVATKKAHDILTKFQELNAKLEQLKLEGKEPPVELVKEAEKAKADEGGYMVQAARLRQKAFEYRRKDYEIITPRCKDADYLAKLDRNYETGVNLSKLTPAEMRAMRRDMQMIFQDPSASLDPRQSVGKAIEEILEIHTKDSAGVRRERVMSLLEQVGLKREHYYSYPHALSGGQKQRVGIARAIALDTKFIVLDESVSALDVSVQAQILQLLNELCENTNRTYFFITHDLGVVKHFCDRILVMYLGNECELSGSKDLFRQPLHPYTKSLLDAVPRPVVQEDGDYTQSVLEGEVPSAVNPPSGCPFHTRCRECMDICKESKPELKEVEDDHFVACHLFDHIPQREIDPDDELLLG